MKDVTTYNYSNSYATVTVSGSPTYSNGTFAFNGSGSQYINAYRTDLNGGTWAYTTMTCCAWINISNSSTAGENNIATVESAWEYKWINNSNGTSGLWYASNPWAWYGPSTAVTNGVWQMITFRHGAVNGDIWSNATQVFTQAISGGITPGTSSYPMLTFMGRSGGPSSPATGSMGPVMIYNRAITDAEIIQNFNATRGRYGI